MNQYCFVLTESPPWDEDFHYTPVEVFTGDGAEQRALAARDREQENPEHQGYMYQVQRVPLNRDQKE